jgi:hypothetical protein
MAKERLEQRELTPRQVHDAIPDGRSARPHVELDRVPVGRG